ncbi:MAG TPA: hypothetical protein VI653_29080 [Steroidobacteraceae bacterium]
MSHMKEEPRDEIAAVEKKVPRKVRDFLFGGYLAVAMAVSILTWGYAPSAIWPVVALLVITGVCVALLGSEIFRESRFPGQALLWAVVVFVVLLLGLFVSTEFFAMPRAGQETWARWLRNPALLSYPTEIGRAQIPAGTFQRPLPVFTSPLVLGAVDDLYARKHALKERPSLVVEGALVTTDGPGTHQTIYVDTLDLEGGVILTKGGTLTIEANRIISNGGTIRAFSEDPPPTATGKGQDGGQVKIVVYDHVDGELMVNLTGGPGARGAKGADGLNGRAGAEGDHSSQSLFGCQHGGGRGENGAAGGPAGNGAPGFAGGDGGLLIVAGINPESLAKLITLDNSVARGGPGGPPGAPGAGGKGGSGGAGGGYCGGGEAGADGAAGATAVAGAEGPSGLHSRLQLSRLPH